MCFGWYGTVFYPVQYTTVQTFSHSSLRDETYKLGHISTFISKETFKDLECFHPPFFRLFARSIQQLISNTHVQLSVSDTHYEVVVVVRDERVWESLNVNLCLAERFSVFAIAIHNLKGVKCPEWSSECNDREIVRHSPIISYEVRISSLYLLHFELGRT